MQNTLCKNELNFEEKVYMIHYFISFHDDFFLTTVNKNSFLCILFHKMNIPFSCLFINIFKIKQLTNLYEDISNFKKMIHLFIYAYYFREIINYLNSNFR